ncbi:hypothetical protein AURDEDRAFT_109560 [Auricularia subglabra TFB-10046 SS5]|nr:hypothetical protein AURDEDRAFT_109560 [Auricularia subglabra TFB-10046 SS5]
MVASSKALAILSVAGLAVASLSEGPRRIGGVPRNGTIARRRAQFGKRACKPTTTPAPEPEPTPTPTEPPAPEPTPTEPPAPPEPSMIPGTWQSFPAPKGSTLLVAKQANDFGPQVVQHTLSGIVTRASLGNDSTLPMWIDFGKQSDGVWRERYVKRYSLTEEQVGGEPDDVWALVKRYKDAGVVKGYVVYNEGPDDNSSNIATSLCGPLSAIAVSSNLEDAAKSAGLEQLADARSMSFGDLTSKYGDQLSKGTLGLLRNDMSHCRDMIVAQNAAVGIDGDGGGYVDLLKHLEPAATVIGYGKSEDGSVHAASTVGAGLVAADWMTNWNVMSLGAREIPVSQLPDFTELAKPTVTDDGSSYYVAFVMTDGDNVQWVLGDYASSKTWYGAPERGEIPFTWGLPISSMTETMPDALGWFAETAKPADKFVNYGDPYLYIDSSSSDPGTFTNMVAKHQQWAQAIGVKSAVIFCEDWQSAGSQAGFDVIAKADPALDAAFMIQYSSYAAGRGALRFGARDDGSKLPVLMAKTHLWSQPDSEEFGGPAHVADQLNNWANGGAGDIKERVAWVPVNAWSTFDMGDGRKVGGYAAARETAGRLGDKVKLVTLPDIAAMLKNA